MDALLALLSQPITQLGGLLALLATLQRAGFDVRAFFKAALGIDSGVEDVNADMRNALQPVLLKIDELAQYANHDTTEHIAHVAESVLQLAESLAKLLDKFDGHTREHDKMVYLMEDLRENGVKCRNNN